MEERRRRDRDVQAVEIGAAGALLEGDLGMPEGTPAVVLFAHGSGSSRLSPRNRFVGRVLREAGLGTLLIDLLTPEEEEEDLRRRHLRFDIELLSTRLVAVVDWLLGHPEAGDRRIGCFGSSTGAAAALIAAARRPQRVQAVVSRGGRPDLAEESLRRVEVPTLLIVGSRDLTVLSLNRKALEDLGGEKQLEIVPGAGHLFEEPGAMEKVAELTRWWFLEHLSGG